MVIRAVSSTPFPCGIPTTCCICHGQIIPDQLMVWVMPNHEGAHWHHEEVK